MPVNHCAKATKPTSHHPKTCRLQHSPPSTNTTATLPSSHTSKINHQLPANICQKSPQTTIGCPHFNLIFRPNHCEFGQSIAINVFLATKSTRSNLRHGKSRPPAAKHTKPENWALFIVFPLCGNLIINDKLPSLPSYLSRAEIICIH